MKNPFTEKSIEELAKAGFDEVYGARPLRRAVTNKIEDALSEKILEGTVNKESKIICDFKDGKFTFE